MNRLSDSAPTSQSPFLTAAELLLLTYPVREKYRYLGVELLTTARFVSVGGDPVAQKSVATRICAFLAIQAFPALIRPLTITCTQLGEKGISVAAAIPHLRDLALSSVYGETERQKTWVAFIRQVETLPNTNDRLEIYSQTAALCKDNARAKECQERFLAQLADVPDEGLRHSICTAAAKEQPKGSQFRIALQKKLSGLSEPMTTSSLAKNTRIRLLAALRS